jgi:hypothetical protein
MKLPGIRWWPSFFLSVPVLALAFSSDADAARQVVARIVLTLFGLVLLRVGWVRLDRELRGGDER